MVGVFYTEGCIILSLTAGPLSVSDSNGKMPTLFLHTNKRVTEQNVAIVVASPLSLWQAMMVVSFTCDVSTPKTKTSSAVISALQYADDTAFHSLTADGLQRILYIMSETNLCAGLIINTTKT